MRLVQKDHPVPRWRLLGLLPLALILMLVGLLLFAQPAAPHPWFRADDPAVLVIAHQGGNHLWPDETMVAFEGAEALGVDVLEMDAHMTADGHVVAIHDATVDRTTDGSGRVSEMTLAELKALDAAYNWTPLTPEGTPINPEERPYRGQGVTVPTIAEVVAAFPEIRLLIEIKQAEPSIAVALCEVLSGREDDVMVASSNAAALREFRRVCPAVATSAHITEVATLFALEKVGLAPLYSPTEVAYQVPREWDGIPVLSEGFVNAAHRRGAQVHPWTINTEDEMRRLIAMGVDGLITDEPGLLLEILGR